MEISSVNESTTFTVPHHNMKQLGKVLPRLIEIVARAPLEDGDIVFSKLDIKYWFGRMEVEKGKHLNFVYVLPEVEGLRIRIVIPKAL